MPYRDGTTHIVMSPLEWMQRLAVRVPRPRMHLIRYHGVLAPNAKWRSRIVPAVPIPDGTSADSAGEEERGGRHYIHWPLTHTHVLRGTWTSCPAGTPAQARIRD